LKLKIDEQGHVVVIEGRPVYIHDDGKEVAFDAPATVATIGRLNKEAQSHRERAEGAEGKLKAFEGIEDGPAAKKALELVANLDAKKLVDAGEIEKVKAEVGKVYQAQLDELGTKATKFEQQLYEEKIGGSFSRSKLIADKLAIPADLVQARFGQAFKIEDGKTVAYDQHGNKIYSRVRPGEIADFDEALEALVEQYPHRDSILKSSGQSGSGATGGTGGTGGKKTLTRAQFTALSPAEQATAAKEATITD
jgi:ribosomal protein L15